MDYLAYTILFLFNLFAIAPAFGSIGNTNIDYLDALKIGIAFQVFILLFGLVFFSVVWSVYHIFG